MTQLDANIILGGRGPQIESPVNALAKIMQVQGLQQQNQLGQMRMDEYRSGVERKNRLASLLQGQYDTPEAREDALLRGGFMEESQTLGKNRLENRKAGLETNEKEFKLANDRYKAMQQSMGALYQNPNLSKDLVLQSGQQLVQMGILPPDMYEKVMATMPDDPNALRQRLRDGLSSQMTPEQILTAFAPKAEKIDNGQQIGFRDMNPNSPTYGQATGGATVQKQMTPGEVASNKVAQGNLAVAQGNLAVNRDRLSHDKSKATGPDGRPSKPMPATALKLQNEALDMVGIASSIQADLGKIEQQIEGGKLAFGPVKNVANNLRNMAGASTEESRNFATFKSTLEKLRNDSLRLNKGVQTDGDAQRAWNELFQNINDTQVVKQRLAEIKAINARAVDLRKREVEDIRNNYNQPAYDFTTQTNVPAAVGTAAPKQTNIDALLDKYK